MSSPRSLLTRYLWLALWVFWAVFVLQQVADLIRDHAPWPLGVLRALPLLVFMPGVAKDNLRSLVWLCFVILFYFVSAVELAFARPGDAIAVLGLMTVVMLFTAATLYIRFRGRELRTGP